jgi:phosphoribosyl-AMP cyclohydrolase / phosphoribosyl-ATP pyrophosphohydrolase
VEIRYGSDGLVPVIVQDRLSGQVRMLAHMSSEALVETIRTRRATFWSRSRGELWEKGKTSGNTLLVESIFADCDADALLVRATAAGPTCHTGAEGCFFRRVGDDGQPAAAGIDARPFLEELEREIAARKEKTAQESYTRHLLDGGAERIGAKLREEADELARAVAHEDRERVANEAADVLYHVMVALASRGVAMQEVISALAARAGQSGHAEKAARGS